MMKRAFFYFMAFVLALSLCACGGSKSTSKCTICRKTATHTFQGSGYCDAHYKDAIIWAMDHVK